MLKTKIIHKSQIIGKRPMGTIKGFEGSENYKNVVVGCLDEDISILIATDLTQQEWDRACSGMLTPEDRFKLSAMGVI